MYHFVLLLSTFNMIYAVGLSFILYTLNRQRPTPLPNAYNYWFSQLWLPTVQDVLQADWQDVWHSPQPPFFIVSFKLRVLNDLICFNTSSSFYWILCKWNVFWNNSYERTTKLSISYKKFLSTLDIISHINLYWKFFFAIEETPAKHYFFSLTCPQAFLQNHM